MKIKVIVFMVFILLSSAVSAELTLDDINKFNKVMDLVKRESIYRFTDEDLVNFALRGMVSVDPYSIYFPPEEEGEQLDNFQTTEGEIPTVVESYEDGIKYISIRSFGKSTGDDFDKEIKSLLKTQGLRGIILDLRDNSGGLVPAMFQVASAILGRGKIICLEINGNGSKILYITDPSSMGIKVPIVVLVNKGSASATEILVASLQDNNAVIVLGEKTFGKGIGQRVFTLEDGSVVKITSSVYSRPNGTGIHEVGITPDFFIEDTGPQ